MNEVLQGWCVLACLGWALAGLRIIWNVLPLRRLRDLNPPEPGIWPTLSVLVPACNEANTLEPAMASLLAQDYPLLEIILVDDRSTDGTGAAVDRIAAADRRVVPLHITTLPAGWLGKVHALQRAREAASGTWLLFTDADVHFGPGALRRAVALAVAEDAGHVAIAPAVPVPGFWLQVAIGAFTHALFLVMSGRKMGKPHSDVMMGIGAFNLVRALDLDASPGLEWLRQEVIDDVGVAQMLNHHGTRGRLLSGSGLLSVEWYPTMGAMVRGLEKGAFAAMGFSLPRVAFATALPLAGFAGLVASPWVLSSPSGWWLVASGWGIYTVAGLFAARKLEAAWWTAPFAPLGIVVDSLISMRSAWRTLRRGGVVWRGTMYPMAELRAGRRIKF